MGIPKVVIGCKDPNPKVAGKGIQKLKEAGCEVIENVLQTECEYLNKRFFTFQQKKRPYILLKWAETKDGFIAPKSKTKFPIKCKRIAGKLYFDYNDVIDFLEDA